MANGTQNPSPPSMIEKLRGKRSKDIRLPQEAHTGRDPRLPTAGPLESIRENVERTRDALRPRKVAKRAMGRRTGARRA